MSLRTSAWAVTSRQGHSQVNEDRYLCEAEDGLFGVFDGECGDGWAADVARSHVLDGRPLLDDARRRADVEASRRHLSEIVRKAGDAILASHVHRAPAASSLLVVHAVGDSLVVAHIGDSRLYVASGASWAQRTREHSLIEEARGAGAGASALAKLQVHATIVTRTLGYPSRAADLDIVRVENGCSIMLCTDGSWRSFEWHESQDAPARAPEHRDSPYRSQPVPIAVEATSSTEPAQVIAALDRLWDRTAPADDATVVVARLDVV